MIRNWLICPVNIGMGCTSTRLLNALFSTASCTAAQAKLRSGCVYWACRDSGTLLYMAWSHRCCDFCPSEDCPSGFLSKWTLSKWTLSKWHYCPSAIIVQVNIVQVSFLSKCQYCPSDIFVQVTFLSKWHFCHLDHLSTSNFAVFNPCCLNWQHDRVHFC